MPDALLPTPATFADVAARIAAIPVDGGTPAAMRAQFATLLTGDAPGDQPLPTVGGVEVLRLPASAPGPDACAVWFHGGGYVFGSPTTHRRAAAAFARHAGLDVYVPRYRLAPEHPWPAPLHDARAVVHALQDEGRRVVLAGDSAGGHLALVTALACARADRPVAALALFSPNTDRTGLSITRAANDAHDPMVSDADDRHLARLTFQGLPDAHPHVSPLLDTLGLLPPAHVEVGAREVLLGDSRLLADRATRAGADVALHVEPEAFHMWQVWTPYLPEADASLARAAAFVRARLDAA